MADEVVSLCPFHYSQILQQHINNLRRPLHQRLRRAPLLIKVPFPLPAVVVAVAAEVVRGRVSNA